VQRRTLIVAVAAAVGAWLCSTADAYGQTPRLIRSQSGPSGRVTESGFVFDEIRNRFVYPQDKTLTVSFEWEFVPGDHVLTATWRMPDGRVASVSPDVKLQTTTADLACLWVFQISPGKAPGTWTVEIRINGQPAGSHAFELAGVDSSDDRFTLDRVFRVYAPSMVRVHRFDAVGRRVDTTNGFVLATGAVATAFQSIDMASLLEVEFADGRRVRSSEVLAFSRLGDWAVIKADTAAIKPIPRGDAHAVPVGGRLALFAVDAGNQLIAAVDVGAVSAQSGYAPRIRFSPAASPEAFGGPLIDEKGTAVGILGGSLTPGTRVDQRTLEQHPWMWRHREAAGAATVIADVSVNLPDSGTGLATLSAAGELTAPLAMMIELTGGGITTQLPKNPNDRSLPEVTRFSARDDPQIVVYTYWLKRGQLSRGELSFAVLDAANRIRGSAKPQKVTLRDTEQRFAFMFPPRELAPGYYRLEVRWNNTPVWRAYVLVSE